MALVACGCGKVVWTLGDPYVPHPIPDGQAHIEVYRTNRLNNALSPVHVVVAGKERILYGDGYAVIPVPPGTWVVGAVMGGSVFEWDGGRGAGLERWDHVAEAERQGIELAPAVRAEIAKMDASVNQSLQQLQTVASGPTGVSRHLAYWTLYGPGMGVPIYGSTQVEVAAGETAVIRVEGGLTQVTVEPGDPAELQACRLSPGGWRPPLP